MVKGIIHWALVAISIMAMTYVVPGIEITSFWSALIAAVVLGILNAIVWPILLILTLPFTLVTFGLFLFILNGLILKFGAALVPGFTIVGYLPAIIGAAVLSILGFIVGALMDKD